MEKQTPCRRACPYLQVTPVRLCCYSPGYFRDRVQRERCPQGQAQIDQPGTPLLRSA